MNTEREVSRFQALKPLTSPVAWSMIRMIHAECLLQDLCQKKYPSTELLLYYIFSDSDLKIAASMQEEYLESATITKTVTIVDFEEKKRSSTTLDNSE